MVFAVAGRRARAAVLGMTEVVQHLFRADVRGVLGGEAFVDMRHLGRDVVYAPVPVRPRRRVGVLDDEGEAAGVARHIAPREVR
jgi:hypothetical protein